jgi:hypothetical protein
VPQHDRLREDDRSPAKARRDPGKRAEENGEREREQEGHPLLGLQGLIGNEAVRSLVEDEGAALPDAFRVEMERSFGDEFGDVRVHQGSEVDAAAEDIDAAAFTVGSDVYMRSDVPSPATDAGRAVLAEELAHVAQGVGSDGAERLLGPGDLAETEAHDAAAKAVAGERATIHPAPAAADAGGRLLIPMAIAGGILIYESLKDEEKTASKIGPQPGEKDPNAPTPEQVSMIQQGVVPQLDTALNKLSAPDVNPVDVVTYLDGVTGFLKSQAPKSLEGLVVSAATSVMSAQGRLMGTADKETAIAGLVGKLGESSGALEGAAAAAKEPEGAPEPTALTPQQAGALRAGPIAFINEASALLGKNPPDVDGAIGKLQGVSGVLSGMSVPPAVAPIFNKVRLNMEIFIETLKGTKQSKTEAISDAASHLRTAKGIIADMSAPPPIE